MKPRTARDIGALVNTLPTKPGVRGTHRTGSAGGFAARVLALLGICACLFGGEGCGTSCKSGAGKPVRFRGGELDASGTSYETSPFNGPFLFFPADRRLDIEHGLGTRDLEVNIFVSFNEDGPVSGDKDSAPSAGNQTTVESVTEQIVRVHNATCSDFYLRLTAQALRGPADAGAD